MDHANGVPETLAAFHRRHRKKTGPLPMPLGRLAFGDLA
jgi:hypothetical protein